METTFFYEISPFQLPKISLLDTVTIHPPYIHFRRKSNEFILYFILSGEMHITENQISYVLSEGDFFLLDPSYEHYGTTPDTCHYFYIHFMYDNIIRKEASFISLKEFFQNKFRNHINQPDGKELSEDSVFIPKFIHPNPTSILNLSQELNHLKSIYHGRQTFQSLESSYLFQLFFLHLSKDFVHDYLYESSVLSQNTIKIILQIMNYLNESFPCTITGNSIEENFSCNFDYINRKFKLYTGKTIFYYLNELRIARATQYLQSGYYTLSEIAEKTGFCDVYYFSKVFKKYKGLSPSEYEKLF